ncbi:MAG TPA: regulatory protein RecX [Candidatus Binatia bacterium]
MTAGSQDEALKRALKFLGYRARSEAEVRTKLTQSGFPPKIIGPTLGKLRSLKLLDDEAFARTFIQGRIEGRGYGPLRLARELRQKGIAQALVARVLDEAFGRQEGKERARALMEKRFRGKDLSDAKNLRRAVAFLQRRGYRDAVIAEILRQPLGDD